MRQRRKPASAIGLSMLDLISNAVAAVFILFILLSAIRLPPIPPERLEGQLIMRYTLRNVASPEKAKIRFWIKEEPGKNPPSEALLGSWFPPIKGDEEPDFQKMVPYKVEKKPNELFLIFDNPSIGKWETLLMYGEHEEHNPKMKPAEAHISIWFVGADKTEWTLSDSTNVTGPTGTLYLPFEVPKSLPSQ